MKIRENLLAHLGYEDRALFSSAWETTRKHFDNHFTFYLPGMIKYGRQRGRYPAISITGDRCLLQCEHCKGRLLEPMIKISGPEELVRTSLKLHESGNVGLLLSGGADENGRLPWPEHIDAISQVIRETNMFISAHIGFPAAGSCKDLEGAGVRQALIDVMGDTETAEQIYHLDHIGRVTEALDNISLSRLQLVPHIVTGLFYGRIRAEYRALEMIRPYHPAALVFVVITPMKGTPMDKVLPPSPIEVARLIAGARLMFPELPLSLGCERPRNKQGRLLEQWSILAGVNRMAVWSEEAVRTVRDLGLEPRYQATCCSLAPSEEFFL